MKRLLRCLLSGVIAVTMFCSVLTAVSAEDRESWSAFDIKITLKSGTPSANQNVVFDISITNTTDKELTTDFINSTFARTWGSTFENWGNLKDSNGTVITNSQGITFASKETKNYTLEGTLPSSWIDYNENNPLESSFITIHVMSGNQHGQNGYPVDGATIMGDSLNAFEVEIMLMDGVIGANQNVSFYVTVTNTSDKELTINDIDTHLYPIYSNGVSYNWGTLKDTNGNIINDSPEITLIAGETMDFTLEGVLPSNWVGWQEDYMNSSFIGVEVKAVGEYYGHMDTTFSDGDAVDPEDPADPNETQYESNIEYPEEIDEQFENDLFEYLSQKGLLGEYSVQDLKDADCKLYIGYDEKWYQLSSDEIKELEKQTSNKIAYKVQIGFAIMSHDGNIYIPVSELHEKVKITVSIPKELQKAGRKFSIIREHDGKYDVLDDMDSDDRTVTFESDKFSDFYLVYNDIDVTTPTVSKDNNKGSNSVKTGDNTNIIVYELICVTTLLGICLLTKRKFLQK